MGNKHSSASSASSLGSKPLKEWSCDELASHVEGHLSEKYAPYAESLRENAVDGDLLASLNEDEFQETLQDLQVSNRLHARVLTNAWKQCKTASAVVQTQHEESTEQNLENPEHTPVALAPPSVVNDVSAADSAAATDANTDIDSTLTFERVQPSLAEYQITEETSPDELTTFDWIAEKAFKFFPEARYSAFNVVDPKGHLAVASRFTLDGGQTFCTDRLHVLEEPKASYCHNLILNQPDKALVRQPLPKDNKLLRPDERNDGATPELIYQGYIVHSPHDGQRIGSLCVVVDKSTDDQNNDEERAAVLKELAEETELQLAQRKVLLDRLKHLQQQNRALEQSTKTADPKTDIVAPSRGILLPVTVQQVQQRQEQDQQLQDNKSDESHSIRSARSPAVMNQPQATTTHERAHLPNDYFAPNDRLGMDHPPVPKNDMERVAVVESLGIHNLPLGDPLLKDLERMTEMATKLFKVAGCIITVLTHDKTYSIAHHFDSDVVYGFYKKFHECARVIDGVEQEVVHSMVRPAANCNYPVHTKKIFTVRDMGKDETFLPMVNAFPDCFRFYSGAPIMWNGHAIGAFCLFNATELPDFSIADQLQQEQMAQLVQQRIDNWWIRQKMQMLEDRRRSSTVMGKNAPPEQQAALLFTDVQGSTRLWEQNPSAMSDALAVHDQIMRTHIAANHGYEVITEGDAFHVAFHDAIDAVKFALDVQEDLYKADWDSSVLGLEDACDDGKGFRGLRVRMGIHFGDVEKRKNEVTKRVEYIGPSFFVTKGLEAMAHGGQILVSEDVWEVASYVSEMSLGSPQVIDLGHHVLGTGQAANEGIISKRVLQLVPACVAFDYAASTKQLTEQNDDKSSRVPVSGRTFPAPLTRRQMSVSFHDAPCGDCGQVCMVFVYTSQVQKKYPDTTAILNSVARKIGSLVEMGPGYQCKDFMVAFSSPVQAMLFGLKLQESLVDDLHGGASLVGLLQVGIHYGSFTSLSPNKSSGRADYFGRVVNRAARVAGATALGEVYIGSFSETAPDLLCSNDAIPTDISTEFVEWRELKGVTDQMALHKCFRAASVAV